MKPVDRVRAAIQGKPVDRVPNAPFYEAPICSYFGSSVRSALMESQGMVDAHLKAIEHYHFDWVILGMNLIGGVIPEALGCRVQYPVDSLPIIEKTVIRTASDVNLLRKADVFTSRMEAFIKAVSVLSQRLKGDVPVAVEFTSPFSIATRLRGTNEIMMDLYDNPQLLIDMQDILVDVDVAIGKAFLEAGTEYIFYGADMECPLLISPDHYKALVNEPTSRVVNELARCGGKVLVHMCGPIDRTGIVDLLLEMDIDGIMPGNLTQEKVLDLVALKRKVGDRTCVFDNLNPNGRLLIGTPEEVEKETLDHLDRASTMSGYIFSTSGTTSLKTPMENFDAMNRTVLGFAGKK